MSIRLDGSTGGNYGAGELTSSAGNTLNDLANMVLSRLPEAQQAKLGQAAETSNTEQTANYVNQQLGLLGGNVCTIA